MAVSGVTWRIQAYVNNAYDNQNEAGIASNDLVVKAADFLTQTGAFLFLSGPGDTIIGASDTQKTYASDNETVAKEKVLYTPSSRKQDTYLVESNEQRLVKTGAFVTGNVINLKVNGVAMTPVPFNTDNNTTLADLATQIATDFSAVVNAATDVVANTVEVQSIAGVNDVQITDVVVTGGASQPTFVVVTNVLTTADIGSFFDINAEQFVDISTKSASTGQLQLLDNNRQEYKIANA